MGFWQSNGYDYHALTAIPEDTLLLLVNGMSREDIIEWLSWNDRNGVYEDERSLKELGNIMSKSEGIEILLRQVEENRTV
jgi:hypothetical protein